MRRYCVAAVALVVFLQGCAARMETIPAVERLSEPPSGKSLVYFVRPQYFGSYTAPNLFDDRTFIGSIEQQQHVAYVAAPGPHRFVAMTEDANFLQAELDPDKIYYVQIQRGIGIARERFGLVPQNDSIAIMHTRDLVGRTEEVRPNENGRRWAEKNAAVIAIRMSFSYYTEWVKNPHKPTLPASSGRKADFQFP